MLTNAFTVDVEDYFQVSAFAERARPGDWTGYQSRVVNSTHRILRLLADRDTRGTFFILGWVADRHPELIRDIHRDGHELGTHSYWHQLVYDQTPEEFRADLRRSIEAIDRAAGTRPRVYRAPSFSITQRSTWALEILRDEGILIDSSIFPIRHDRYGMPSIDPAPHHAPLGCEGLWEVPPSIFKFGSVSVPIAGGGYFRIFPEFLTRRLQSRFIDQQQRPLVFYIHPWEVDPDQPRMPAKPLTSFRHYRNLHATEPRLERMLDRISFGTLGELVQNYESGQFRRQPELAAA